jgi:predicted ArsR family transcriptional regulator
MVADLGGLVRALSNPTARALLAALQDGPSHPRALAARLALTEGQVQKRLHDLAAAGLVEAAWHHEGKTVRRYSLRAVGVRFAFDAGRIVPSVEARPPVGAIPRAP